MRIRQVRPEFWTDPVVSRLPAEVRLFYIGLWNAADDAGWLNFDPAELGALLFPFASADQRETDIRTWADALAAVGRVVLHDCGCAVVPTLPKHQRVSGVQSFRARDHHEATHRPLSDTQSPLSTTHDVRNGTSTHDTQSPLSDSPVEGWDVEERRGDVARDRATDGIPAEAGASRRADIDALRAGGWKRVTPKQRLVLDGYARDHDGHEWAADRIRSCPAGVDYLTHLKAEHDAQVAAIAQAEATWQATKEADRAAATSLSARLAADTPDDMARLRAKGVVP